MVDSHYLRLEQFHACFKFHVEVKIIFSIKNGKSSLSFVKLNAKF